MKKFYLSLTLAPLLFAAQVLAAPSGGTDATQKTDGVKPAQSSSANSAQSGGFSENLGEIEVVNSTNESVSGSGFSEHFLQKNALFGALVDKKIKDIPLQINVVTNELATNLGAGGLDGVWRTIPSATVSYMGSGSVARPGTRGMYGGVIGNNYWDGFMVTATTAVPMMIFDKLEVQNGISGSLYGSQHPSGIFNYTRKRPVPAQAIVRLDWNEKSNFGTMVDVSDKNDYVGARGIFYFNDGEGFVKDSVKRSKLANLGLDFYLSDNLTLETNFTYYNFIRYGYGGRILSPQAGGVAKYKIPKAIANDTYGLSQTWSGMDLETYAISSKLKYTIRDDWYIEGGFQRFISDRHTMEAQHTLAGNDGTVVTSVGNRGTHAPRFTLDSWFLKSLGYVSTGPIEHDIGLSTYGYVYDSKTALQRLNNAMPNVTQNLNNLQRFPKTEKPMQVNLKRAIRFTTNNVTLADDIKFSDRISLLLAATHTWVNQKSFRNNAAGTDREQVGSNKDKEFTYLAGLTFRPSDDSSIYFSYSDSIQVDGLVPPNYEGGRTLVYVAPVKTKQYELGTKFTVGGADVSAALFQIERPLYYRVANAVFVKQGKQQNRGFEMTAGGKLGEYFSLYGGFMLLDPKLKNTYLSAMDGKTVVGAPKFQSNLLLDFSVPGTEKLSFMSNLHYTGKRYADDANTQSVDGYFTTDLGVRYVSKSWLGKESTIRFNANNIFDKKYYVSVRPGESDGAGTGTTDMYLGDGRNFTASFEVKF